jgi:hypothetical protein
MYIGLALFVISEILPFLPIKPNGLVDGILSALKMAFPKPSKPE